ncbi:unnamed protein product [Paramecium octaurelia]|uniref:Core Histone H2A/H2B/H3 domain-containing protein n=1 Tax=Paramecium octaurelia TaxID=43137 RepID=A0A8S1X074_PAROT|nr:unnamed protein product [Paramecium octaurelia]
MSCISKKTFDDTQNYKKARHVLQRINAEINCQVQFLNQQIKAQDLQRRCLFEADEIIQINHILLYSIPGMQPDKSIQVEFNINIMIHVLPSKLNQLAAFTRKNVILCFKRLIIDSKNKVYQYIYLLIKVDEIITKPNFKTKNLNKSHKKQTTKKKSQETFNCYINKIFRSVHPELSCSRKALRIVNQFTYDIFEKIMQEVKTLLKITIKKTLMARDILTAVRFLFPGELGKHAAHERVRLYQGKKVAELTAILIRKELKQIYIYMLM